MNTRFCRPLLSGPRTGVMGASVVLGARAMADYTAQCDVPACAWQRLTQDHEEGRTIAVLHALVRHPDIYQDITGKDALTMRVVYSPLLLAYQGVL